MKKAAFLNRFILLPLLLVIMIACEDTPTDATTIPVILSLTTDKIDITSGGDDMATLTCEAEGGNLEYLWEVDLGDIFPVNESDPSVVIYSGASCCIGDKEIKCTVSNGLGSVTETVNINILEQMQVPVIEIFESDKYTLALGETAEIKCIARGGEITYTWEKACGTIESVFEEGWLVKYTPDFLCPVGVQTITCTVKNPLGEVSKSLEINIGN